MKKTDNTDIEVKLKRLKPLAPSRALKERLRTALENDFQVTVRSPVLSGWNVLGMVTAAMAAAALLLFAAWLVIQTRAGKTGATVAVTDPVESVPAPRAATPSEDAYELVSVDRVVVGQRDQGTVVLRNGQPARRICCDYVDHIEWRNPHRRTTFTTTLPRKHIKLVSMETY